MFGFLLIWGCGESADRNGSTDGDLEASPPAGDADDDFDAETVDDETIDGEGLETEPEIETVPIDWPDCPEITGGVSLADKAAAFDRIAREVHLAGDGLLRNIYLTEDLQGVEMWQHVENTILWSGIYLASQAFRYVATGEAEAQENARRVADALHKLTLVTGSRGLYGRSMSDPSVTYNPVAADNPGWTDSPAPGFEGWRFRNDVSKDGYAGLMFGYAAALEHFDDPALLADVRERVREIADHLIGNGLQIIDANGKVTEHGRLFHSALDDWPGFNAMLASSWIKIAASELGDPALDDFYYGCLMNMRAADCPDIEEELWVETLDLTSYIASMEERINLFQSDCKQNYDNFDMCYQAVYPLFRRESDPGLRERLRGVLISNMFHTEDPDHQSLAPLGNTFFTFVYAVLTGISPDDEPLLGDAVDRAVCKLKEFPAEKYERFIPAGQQESVCTSRLGEPIAAEPIPLSEYYFDNYLWRLDFFEIQIERPENRRQVYSPEDYLMAYWLGRYHGLIGPDL